MADVGCSLAHAHGSGGIYEIWPHEYAGINLMPNAHSNYRGKIPFELYIRLESEFPRLARWERDKQWLTRIMRDPNFKVRFPRLFLGPEHLAQVKQAVHRRWMALAGARRVGSDHPGPALIRLKNNGAKSTIANRYRDDLLNADGTYKHADEAYDLLLADFDATTPANGSIFWNGINELALAKLVDEWNAKYKNEIFGQLEATTAARYVNKQFVWEDGGKFQEYFTEISDRLGRAARGHITSVVRCGLRDDSIFTTTELPRLLESMETQIKGVVTPTVTDITIVVIEPKHLEERQVKAFTNNEITMIPIIGRAAGAAYINGRKDCTVKSHLDVNPRVREYWKKRNVGRSTPPSEAAEKIMADFKSLVRWD